MTQLRVVPKNQDGSVINFLADDVVLDQYGWKCHREGKFAGYVWAGYAQLYSADNSAKDKALVVLA